MTSDAGAQVEIRRLTEADADAFRVLRLAGLRETPEAFGSSYEEEAARSREHFAARAAPPAPSATFGAFVGGRLVGIAGLAVSDRLKERHKGYMWGVFVRAEFRGQGLGRQLVRQVIDTAAGRVRILQCSVVIAQEATRRMYHAMGFVPYGLERKALCVDGVFHDEELLAIDFEGRS
ncbi:Protein N-acetyltransferase, RimJ/RimL family [Mesorhizobium albiziae]|uniref:Protein N-acetyltransferase, RimJ/RimL family n=1 Tax=Neomesorhizobium albiziae TaxID=335020 RepID=A0A1I3Y1W4_9HYPH|nr:GNAT family N-acetyltransferase [Mesorhizobium albiziae]GLS30195.1 N-acetyltransferase [Mesorhizobium albiziae]SFK25246.1 Protein N-acetyltransferase, RimJ/RimL family [Mesorhizobium albiziae]